MPAEPAQNTQPGAYSFEEFPRKTRVPTAEAVEAVATALQNLKLRLDSLTPISLREPNTVYEMRQKQGTMALTLNQIIGHN